MCISNSPAEVHAGEGAKHVREGLDDLTLGYSKIWENGGHPNWGSETLPDSSAAHGRIVFPVSPAIVAQKSRWGAVLGQDDTTDTDLARNGGACCCWITAIRNWLA